MQSSLQKLSRFEIFIYYPVTIVATMLFFANLLALVESVNSRTVLLTVLGVVEMAGLWGAPVLLKHQTWPVRVCLWPLFILMVLWVLFAGMQMRGL